MRWRIGTELDGTPETLFQVIDQQHQYQVSQEFQLLGKALDGKLNYVTGLYYFKEAGYVHDYVPFEGILEVYDVSNDAENVNYAAYFHADYNPTSHWGFTVGGRYTDAQAYFLPGQSDLNSFPLGSTVYPAGHRPAFPALLPGHLGRPAVAHLRSDRRHPVSLQRRRHGVRELEQGLHGRRLDHPRLGSGTLAEGRRVRSRRPPRPGSSDSSPPGSTGT